jgi:hypothetical protein
VRLTIGSLAAGLAVGVTLGLVWPDPGPTLRERRRAAVHRMEAAVTARARQDARAGEIRGPILRSRCDPVRGTRERDPRASVGRYRCIAVQTESARVYTGQVYLATIAWRTGRVRVRRFEIPLYWGV